MENVPEVKYPVDVTIEYPETSSRWLAFCSILFLIPKLIILIPHLIAIYFVGIFAFICAFCAQVVVLFTGKYPHGIFDIVRGVYRWQIRVNAYLLGLTDHYPPFKLHS